jgi:hypothetical protein
MPGGAGFGVIFDAISKLKSNRNIRTSNRGKFKGNHAGDTVLNSGKRQKIEFPKLSERQVNQARERIRIRHEKRRKNRIWILSIALFMIILSITILGIKTEGFEYWDDLF